jgi:hypothetical protein
MPLAVDHDDREDSRLQQLLALQKLRRDLERRAPSGAAPRSPEVAVMSSQLVRELQELIAALDRRVPRVEQAGEASIARDAAALRAKAVKRLAELVDEDTSEVPSPTARSTRRAVGEPG